MYALCRVVFRQQFVVFAHHVKAHLIIIKLKFRLLLSCENELRIHVMIVLGCWLDGGPLRQRIIISFFLPLPTKRAQWPLLGTMANI